MDLCADLSLESGTGRTFLGPTAVNTLNNTMKYKHNFSFHIFNHIGVVVDCE